MSQRFEEGDEIVFPIRIAPGIEKRRLGEVIKLGKDGVRVRFADNGAEMWLKNGQVHHPSGDPGLRIVRRETPQEVDVSAKFEAPPSPPVASVESETARTLVDSLGNEALAVWARMGEQLLGAARKRDADARAAVETARQFLEEAERDAADARANLDRIERAVRVASGT